MQRFLSATLVTAVLAFPTETPWQALTSHVDEARMQQTVRELCAIGARMGGTESGDQAAAYLAAAYREAGIEVEIREDPSLMAHQEKRFRVSVRLPGPEGDMAPGIELAHAWPYGFSPSGSGTVSLSLEATDGGAQLKMRHRGGSRFRKQAVDADAPKPAVILVDGNCTIDGSWPRVNHLSSTAKDQAPVFGINAQEGRLLRALLASNQVVEIEYELESVIAEGVPKTVVARIPARAGAEPGFLLYCAHGDSDAGGPGADDNASGTAVVLEIARAWQAAIAAGQVEAPVRELRFATWGSEIHSSRAFMQAFSGDDTPPILGVINYDQAGFGSGANQFNIEPDDLPANRAMVAAILACLDEEKGGGGFPERWATNKSLGGTDSYVFSGSKGFKDGARPALTLFTSAWDHPDEQPRTDGMLGESWSERDRVNVDYDNFYHSAGDTPENTTDLEPWNMGWCARVGLAGGLTWLQP